MRYWIYKCNNLGGPAGYHGDWSSDVFSTKRAVQWGGSYSTRSNASHRHLNDNINAGDVVVAYQTDAGEVIGTCEVTKVTGPPHDRKLWLKPIQRLPVPLKLHQAKRGTALESSVAIRRPHMLEELSGREFEEIAVLAGMHRVDLVP